MGEINIPTVKPRNECDVTTIFPMGVECFVLNPSSDKTFDGAAALSITGGTPPYTIYWEVGSYAPALANLGIGEYSATVVDYYGDFTANTTCVLTAETITLSGMCFVLTGVVEDHLVYLNVESSGLRNGKPYYEIQYGIDFYGYVFWSQANNQWIFCETLDCQNYEYSYLNDTSFYPSGTTGSWQSTVDLPSILYESYVGMCSVPVPPVELYDLCVSIQVREFNGKVFNISVVNVDLSPAGIINEQQSWTSSTSQYLLYWDNTSTPNRWVLSGFSPTTLFVNNDPSYPPLSNWSIIGNPNVVGINVNTGNCSSEYSISVNAIHNDALCEQGGSITVTASGGVSPYSYSINGGQSFQSSPIFNNLTPGIYSVVAKDVNNSTTTFGNVTIGNTPSTTYQLELQVDYVNNTFSITAPTLPGGVTLSADLVMTSIFSYYPSGLVPTPTYDNITTIQGSYNMTLTNIATNTGSLNNPCFDIPPITISTTQTQFTYTNTLTFTSNQTITGSTTNIITNNPEIKCTKAIGYYYLNLANPRINGCQCCGVHVINPIPPIPPSF